jgi:hypothetical protein
MPQENGARDRSGVRLECGQKYHPATHLIMEDKMVEAAGIEPGAESCNILESFKL